MQTKQQIQALLASMGASPKKRFGQNFLIDLNLMRLLIDEAGICKDDVVLEVGTGTGSFTEGLAEAAGKVITVDVDTTLFTIASKQLADRKNVQLINADILKNKHRLARKVVEAVRQSQLELCGRVLLVANLPYQVAATVMVNLITGEGGSITADAMCVTIQKEVADRMVAAPNSGDYGVLSIFMQATGEATVLRKLKPSVFWPAPQVESSMVKFVRDEEKVSRIHDMEFFRETVNLFMGHRRKMMQACVKFADGRLKEVQHWHDIFERAFVDPHARGENVDANAYISIANMCYEQLR
ncbi:MAG: ribosomal RNA small subunit methyltransferase A [Planctomycetes bacterium]|nr:ribosomal RNA small subunit methyltransferase A [Planctomycetota bacterium]